MILKGAIKTQTENATQMDPRTLTRNDPSFNSRVRRTIKENSPTFSKKTSLAVKICKSMFKVWLQNYKQLPQKTY